MIRCAKCDNDTRTSELITPQGPVLIAGTLSTDPQPVIAQVCTACGYIELYAPQPIGDTHAESAANTQLVDPQVGAQPVPVA